jgi:hypothetical protein
MFSAWSVPRSYLEDNRRYKAVRTTGQSFRVPNVNSLPLDKMLKVVVTVVQQIMTVSNAVVLRGG